MPLTGLVVAKCQIAASDEISIGRYSLIAYIHVTNIISLLWLFASIS